MCDGDCPAHDELCQFLDDELKPDRQAEIGNHVDMCLSCQSVLEMLTRRRAMELVGMSTESLYGSPGSRAHDQNQTADPAGGEDTDFLNAIGRPFPNADSGSDDQSTGDSLGDSASTRSSIAPGATSTHHESPDPNKPKGAIAGMARGERDLPFHLPQIGSYELIELLGEGGMGVVYKARQRGLNRLVAVKMIRADRRSSPDRLARFRTEAEAVARLQHPNIVQIFEIGEVEGTQFASLELLEGGTLSRRLAGAPQPGRACASLLITLAKAVQVAHDAGIIHRDLKPSNILFTDDGIPKITDFGLAKRLESDSGQTESGQIMGSPSYMAPEQARGHTRDIGPAADVYALGAILYEILTGRPPFKAETPVETLRQVIDDEVVPPSRLVPRIARDLETICLRCLHKDRSRRYGSATALAEDLERFLNGRPVKARRTPFWERAGKLARRHPVAAALSALGLTATVVAAGARLQYSARETQRQADLRSRITGSLFGAQALLAKEQWDAAEPKLTGIQAEIRGEHSLTDLASRTAALLAQAQRGRDADKTKRHDQERHQMFRKCRQDALFYETHFTGLGLAYEPESVKSRAWAVLAIFAAPESRNVAELGPLPEGLTPRERDEIKEGCFEMLLILADAEHSAERSLGLLDQAGRLGPPTRAYLLRKAECLDRRGDASAAEAERKRAEALDVDSALDHYLLGKALYKRKEWSAALVQFHAALLRHPGHFWAHCLSAVCNLQLRRPFQAHTDLSACLQSEPDLPWLYELRGFASYQFATMARAAAERTPSRGKSPPEEVLLQLRAAEEDYNRAFELLAAAPSKELRYSLLVNRGLLRFERCQWEKAVADLREAIKLDDRQWPAFEILARVYERQDKPDPAIEQFTRAIELRPNWAPLYRARAEVNRSRKDQGSAHRASALADLEQAIRLEPAGTAVLALDQAHRARLLLQAARQGEALAAAEAAIRIDRDHLEAHLVRAEVLRNLNRYDDLVKSCDALLARGQPSAELYQLRGLAREKTKDHQGAIEDYTLAIGMKPSIAPIWTQRGMLYLAADAPRSALRDFQEAIRLDSTNADAYVGRGMAQVALGQHREGASDAATALKMGEPTAKRLYGAARIYAQAAYAVGAEARKNGQDAVSLFTRYQDQAMSLLREWLRQLPAADRASSLHDLQDDPAMAILRRRLRSLDLAKTS